MQKIPKNRFAAKEYIEGIKNGDNVMLARAITLVESRLLYDTELAAKVLEGVMPYTGKSLRVGITGVPGVGKSSFIESFGRNALEAGHKLAVLAIDPSSQITGGSILGDKTRMEWLSQQKNVFIRPTPSGLSLGGVSRKTRETMLLCEAAGYDMIFIETVGVGQSETIIAEMTDFFLLLMLAGAGDELQGIKRGIMEMADAVVITKADGENEKYAQQAKQNYANALHLFPAKESKWIAETHVCSAQTGLGLAQIYLMLKKFEDHTKFNAWFFEHRKQQNLKWLRQTLLQKLEDDFFADSHIKYQYEILAQDVANNLLSPAQAADKLLDFFKKK